MNKRLNQKKWKSLVTGVLLAVSASGIIAAPAWAAAEYSEGLVGTVKDDSALLKDAGTTVNLDKTTNTITYDFNGEDATFNVAEHDGIGMNTDADNKNYTFNNIREDGSYGTLHIYQKNTGRNDYAGVTGFSADNGKVIVNSNLDITATSAYASVGISAANLADVLINGNVKMRKDDPNSPWGIITKNVHGNVGPGGAVSMDGGYDANYTGARWNPVGLSVGYTGGNITVKGDVDIAVRGTAVRTDAYSLVQDPSKPDDPTATLAPYDAAVISLVGSSIKIDTPYREENTVEGFGTFVEPYYALASYGGTINVNVENMQAGSGKVEIVGNVLAMKRSDYTYASNVYQNGRINLALTTADSFWKGIIDNANMCQNKDADDKAKAKYDSSVTPFFADHSGEINLWLQNGAQWIYENASRKDGLDYKNMPEYSQPSYGSYDGISHLTTLVGGKDAASAGIIRINDEDPIEIGSAEGVTKVWYDHNDATPASMIGGDVKVLTAKTGAEMLLYTGNNGLDKGFDAADAAVDKNKVSEVLNSLAQKLWYMAGDTKLSGTVTIADGLTASSTSMKVGNITFSDGTNGTKEKGQGFYDYTPETDGNEQSKTEFSQGIFGVEKHDTEYAEGNVLQKDGTYRFTEDTSISLGDDVYEIVDGSENAYDADVMGRPIRSHSVIAAIADATSDKIVIDAAGKELNMKIAGGELDLDDDNSNVSLITASGTKDKTAEVNITAKNLNLSMPDDTMSQLGIGYAGYAIYADNNSRIAIDGNVNMDMIDGMGIALGQMGGGDGDSKYSQNEVTISGDLNITNAGAGINIGGGNSKVVVKGHTSINNMRDKVGGASYEGPFGVGIFNIDDADDTLSDESTISLGASDIEMAEGKSAVYGRKGTININTGADETQTGTTVIAGNVISDGGTINLALSDEKSYLKGRIQTNGGKINLALSDGAFGITREHLKKELS